MNQSQFFNALRNKLSSDFSNDEVNQIIEFYTMRFRNGLEQGRSEKELIAEFGNPNNIVHALNPQKSSPNSLNSLIYFILILVGIFPIFEFIFQFSNKTSFSQSYVNFACLYAAIAPVLLCWLRQFIHENHAFISVKRKNACLTFQIVSVVGILLSLFVFSNVLIYTFTDTSLLAFMNPVSKFITDDLLQGQFNYIAPMMLSFFFLFVLLFVAVWFITLFFEKSSYHALSMGVFISAGLLQTATLIRTLLCTLSDINSFTNGLVLSWMPLVVSLISGIVFLGSSYLLPKVFSKHHLPQLSTL